MILRWFWGRELSLETWHFVDVALRVVSVWNGGQVRCDQGRMGRRYAEGPLQIDRALGLERSEVAGLSV